MQVGLTFSTVFTRTHGRSLVLHFPSLFPSLELPGKFSILSNIFFRGIFITGTSILGSAIKMPRIVSKNLVSVIFCEAVAIYGLILAIIMQGRLQIKLEGVDVYANLATFQQAEYSGFCLFAAGLVVGLSNAACGMSVGVIGSGTANTHAQKPETFVSMLIIEIFASALGLYGIIIGIIMSNSAKFPEETVMTPPN